MLSCPFKTDECFLFARTCVVMQVTLKVLASPPEHWRLPVPISIPSSSYPSTSGVAKSDSGVSLEENSPSRATSSVQKGCEDGALSSHSAIITDGCRYL